MPEDYQAILNDLGVDTSGQADPTDDANTVDTDGMQDESNTGASATSDTTNADSNQDPAQDAGQQDPQYDIDAQRRNDAFAAMRSENSKYKKFIGQLMKGAGFNGKEEDFINQLQEASYQQQAKRQGNQVSPEVLKRMDALEAQNNQLLESQNRQAFAANLKNMQDTLHLSNSDIKEFLELAVKEQIDLTIPGTNFVTLYRGLFFDKVSARMIEEERQKWIAQSNKANSAANPDGKSGKKDPAQTNVNTMAEFDSLLQTIPNK